MSSLLVLKGEKKMWLLLEFAVIKVGLLGFAASRDGKDTSSIAAIVTAIKAVASTATLASEI